MMKLSNLYEETLLDIERKSENKEKGILEGIPFPFLKLQPYIPVIEKGVHIGILGTTGAGKSTYARMMYIYHAIKFAIETNYKLKIFFFSIEDAKMKVMKKIMNHYLYERHGESVGYNHLNSQFGALSKYRLDRLKEDKIFYDKLLSMLFIIDSVSSPSNIDKAMTIAKENGTIKEEDHVIVVVDNYDNITQDAIDKSKWEALNRLSHQIIRLKLCKQENYTCVSILQQDSDQERHSFRSAGAKGGGVGMASIEPSLASIAGSKEVSRHMHQVYGIFNPWRYEIGSYPHADGWKTDILRNRFRSFLVLKQNDNEMPSGRLGMLFDGKIETFEEVPSYEDKEGVERIYERIRQEETEKRARFQQGNKLFY